MVELNFGLVVIPTKPQFMKKLNVLAVENDSVQQDNLRKLSESLDINLTDIVGDASVAIEKFRTATPDLVLMDAKPTGSVDGFHLAETLKKIQDVPVVYLTNPDDPGNADFSGLIEGNCVYKPLDEQQLRRSIELAVKSFRNKFKQNQVDYNWSTKKNESFFVRIGNKLKRVETHRIEYIEVEEKYCSIIIDNRQINVKITLKEFLAKLPPEQFVRVHRNFVVNTEYIQTVQLNENLLVLPSREVPFSRTYRDKLIDQLNLI